MSLMEAARRYAAQGFPVFPVHRVRNGVCSCNHPDCAHPGKHPRTAHGFLDATKDPKCITEWWTKWPDANIAIPTGAASGLLVIDIDPRNGGDESWEALTFEFGRPPDTAEQLSGGGGRHVFFTDPGVSVPKELAPGIDIKSAGGYIIVAPSVHPSGRQYAWDGLAGKEALFRVAPVPGWLSSLFPAARNGAGRSPVLGNNKWPEGQRNNQLTSLAGSMRRRGISHQAIEAALLEENRQRCDPPLAAAEVRGIAESVSRYPPAGDVQHTSRIEDWPEPIPFAQAVPDPIPDVSVPGWLGEMARATAAHTETPFDLSALLSVAIASACLAGKAVVSPEPGYFETLNIYTCPAMESGNRKTSVFNTLLGPFAEWERDQIARIEPERKYLASERRTGEARIERLRKKAAAANDPAALVSEIHEFEAKLPSVPPLPRLYADDCTPERLASLMAEQGGRIAVFSDEGGVFDLIAGRYSKGVPNLDLWLKGHSVSPVRVDRADRARPPILLDRPHLTVGISPQPDVLESLQDKPGFRGRGLLARFLYGLPKSPLGYRTLQPRAIPGEVERRYYGGIHQLLQFAPEKAIEMTLSLAAYDEWKAFQRVIELQFREGGALHGLRDWGSKLPGAALRLAGIFHATEQVGHASFDPEIPLSTMARALDFASCLMSHAQAVFALMERDPSIENAQKLIAWIVRQGQASFTVRDCFRAHQLRFKRVDAMTPVLSLLEQHGYIRRQQVESSGGRNPSDICDVNPATLNPKGAV
jgi:hypothetical protein